MQDETNQARDNSSWFAHTGKILGALAGLLSAVGLGYSYGKDTGIAEREFLLRQIETSEEAAGAVAIIENLDRLAQVGDQLFNIEAHAQETTELRKIIDQERAEGARKSERIAELELNLVNTVTKLREASEELKQRNRIEKTFALRPNTSDVFLDGGLPIAVRNIYGSDVAINVLGRSLTMSAGDTKEIVKGSAVCTLTLASISENWDKVNFNITCS